MTIREYSDASSWQQMHWTDHTEKKSIRESKYSSDRNKIDRIEKIDQEERKSIRKKKPAYELLN